jgi:hypothetical protein
VLTTRQWAMPWSDAGFTTRRLALGPRPDNVGFAVDKAVVGQVFLQPFRFSLISIIPQVLQIYFSITRFT